MPTTIPNFLNNSQSPLGKAFANLSQQIAAQPSAAESQQAADNAVMAHWKMLGMQGLGTQLGNGFPAGAPPSVGTGGPTVSPVIASTPADAAPSFQNPQAPSPLAAKLAQLAPTVPVPTPRPDSMTAPMPAQAPTAQVQSPVVNAFTSSAPPSSPPRSAAPAIDMGQYTRNALFAGVKPEEAGGYKLLGDASTYGARDPRTINDVVGSGKPYSSTAESFDVTQSNDLNKNQANNAQSGANNTATNATSRANNQANIQKDYGIEGMKEKNANAQADAAAGNWTPAATDYAAEIYRRTGQLPAVGMGKSASTIRGTIVNRAAQMDQQDGKNPGDTVAGFAEYKGGVAGEQTLGRRGANAGMAVNELTNLIPVAKAALAPVSRTGFVPADTLLQAYQNGTDDPQLAQAATAVNDVVNAHARAINPNGEVTDAGRAQGYKLLSTAQNQEAFNATLDQMMVGAQAALKSPTQTRTQLHSDIAGQAGRNAPAATGWSVKQVSPKQVTP